MRYRLWRGPRRGRVTRRQLGRTQTVLVIGVIVLVGFAALLREGAPAAAQSASGAIRVIDGDTIELGDDKFRLLGFDTPETYYAKCAAEKARGNAATARLRELIAGGDVQIAPTRKKDKYGRGLATLYVGGRDVAAIMIEEGLARPYRGGRRGGWCS